MKTINMHVSDAEHAFLKYLGGRDKRTISDIMREWIRREQTGDVHGQLRDLTRRVEALENGSGDIKRRSRKALRGVRSARPTQVLPFPHHAAGREDV